MSWETVPKERHDYLVNIANAAGMVPSPYESMILQQLGDGLGRVGVIGPGEVSPAFVALLCANPKVVGRRGLTFRKLIFDEPLDISCLQPDWPLVFRDCVFTKGVVMGRASLRAVRFERCEIQGGLDGDRLVVAGSFEAVDCDIHGGVVLLGAEIGGVLDLSGCILNNPAEFALRATGCRVGGTVYCRRSRASGRRFIASGAVRFRYAKISGNLHLAGAVLWWGRLPPIHEVLGGGADSGKIDGVALDADGMSVGGHLLLRRTNPPKGEAALPFFAHGRVSLSSCEIHGQLVCTGAHIRAAQAMAADGVGAGSLWADCVRVGRSVYLDRGFHSIGEVSLDAAEIGGRLDCSGGKFESRVRDGKAARVLSVCGASIARSVRINWGFEAEGGRVDLIRTRVGGHLQAQWARFHNPDHTALSLSQAKITGMVRLGRPANDPFEPAGNADRYCHVGAVRMAGAHIGDNLECDDGLFMLNEARKTRDAGEKALWAARAVIHGHVRIRSTGADMDCGIFGQMGFRGAVVHGNFHLGRMIVTVRGAPNVPAHGGPPKADPYPEEMPRSYVEERPNVSITLIRADIRGSAFMEECRFEGELRLHAMRVGGLFSLVGTRVVAVPDMGGGSLAIAANGIRIEGELFMQRGFVAMGEVRLFGARVGGRILCHSARLINPGGRALSLDLVKSSADIWLRKAIVRGGISLKGAEVGGSLVIEGCRLGRLRSLMPAINLDQADLTGALEIKAWRPKPRSNGKRGEISRSLPIQVMSVVMGTASLRGTRIAGEVRIADSRLYAPDCRLKDNDGLEHALEAEGMTLGGRADFSNNCKVFGSLRLRRGRIDGDVLLNTLEVSNGTPKGDSVSLRGTAVGGALVGNGLKTRGRFDLSNATVDGRIIMEEPEFAASGAGWIAVYADHLNARSTIEVTARPHASRSVSVRGCISLYSARIGGGLTLRGLRLMRAFAGTERAGRVLVDAQDMNVAGEFEWTGITYEDGNQVPPGDRATRARGDDLKYVIDLTEATVLGLRTDLASWRTDFGRTSWIRGVMRSLPLIGGKISPPQWFIQVALGGLTYKWVTLEASQGSYSKALLPWLNSQEARSFSLQPFEQLREALYRMGSEFEAREVSFEKMHQLTRRHRGRYDEDGMPERTPWQWFWYGLRLAVGMPFSPLVLLVQWFFEKLRRVAFRLHAWIMEYCFGFGLRSSTGLVIALVWLLGASHMHSAIYHAGDMYPARLKEFTVYEVDEKIKKLAKLKGGVLSVVPDELIDVCPRADDGQMRRHPLPCSYPAFQPFAFTLDSFVPFLNLHVEEYWEISQEKPSHLPASLTGFDIASLLPAPVAGRLGPAVSWRPLEWLGDWQFDGSRIFFQLHIVFGWIWSTMMVGSLTGLLRRD